MDKHTSSTFQKSPRSRSSIFAQKNAIPVPEISVVSRLICGRKKEKESRFCGVLAYTDKVQLLTFQILKQV